MDKLSVASDVGVGEESSHSNTIVTSSGSGSRALDGVSLGEDPLVEPFVPQTEALEISPDENVVIPRSSAEIRDLPQGPDQRTNLLSTQQRIRQTHDMVFASNQLRFDLLGIYGRTSEKEILLEALVRAANGGRELVVISGKSGTGKTVLAYTMEGPTKNLGGLVVGGKCDTSQREEPYAGLASACKAICGYLIALNLSGESKSQGIFNQIQQKIVETLQEDLHVLAQIVPEISEIITASESITIPSQDSMQPEQSDSNQGSKQAKAKLLQAFRKFFRAICQFKSAPLVVVLDDVQWADAPTLEVIQSLITDVENGNLLFFCLYRSEEVDDDHLVTTMCQELRIKKKEYGFGVTEICISEFTLEETNEFLSQLMGFDDNEVTMELADVCKKRTLGNAFFLVIFLRQLCVAKMLKFNDGSYRWEWKIRKLIAQTRATTNVVGFMKTLLQTLPNDIQQRLSVASYMGKELEPKILDTVWSCISSNQSIKLDVRERESHTNLSRFGGPGYLRNEDSWVPIVEQEGFIERLGEEPESRYKWVHDKVQEAAMSLVPEASVPGLKTEIGQALLANLTSEQLDSHIFVLVNLMNEGIVPINSDSALKLAELNMVAATKAVGFCAFESAKKYANKGIDLLPEDRWSSHEKLSLDLYCTAIESEYSCGHFDNMRTHYEEVVSLDIDVLHKMRAYSPMIEHLGGSLQFQQASDLLLDLLEQFGYSFPRSKVSIGYSTLSRLIKVRGKFKKMDVKGILDLPRSTNRRHVEVMRLLSMLSIASYRSDKIYVPLCILQNVKLTLEAGVTESSAPVIPQLGFLFSLLLKDYALCKKCGQMGQLLLDKYKFRSTTPRTLMILNIFCRTFFEPLSNIESPLMKAYRVGMSIGDFENSMLCIFQNVVVGFQNGRNLDRLEADIRIYSAQMAEFKRISMLMNITTYWLAIVHLMGSEATPLPLQGVEATTTLAQWEDKHREDVTVVGIIQLVRSQLFAIYGEDEEGAIFSISKGESCAKANPGHFTNYFDCFARAVNLYATARRTKNRMYKKQAHKLHSQIRGWATEGCVNVLHYERYLNAEEMVLKGKLDHARNEYQTAISMASQFGCTCDAALMNERFGEVLLNDCSNTIGAMQRLEEAMRLYGELGARRKVFLLQKKHANLWKRPDQMEIVM
eukprot:CAMPEP_0172446238 /NCGR_PEP_ID=MMETSP1065-20121228/5883_1 /TAXON_ID=265537 /ORGANISM="Amphiprora paludosa, Strain CCMP125" /LENGTH=1156 /DNA_ID=CAMNT_0013197305 /DNA_START=111 /DNA_END=3581 /DNA_ORIENTATION=+